MHISGRYHLKYVKIGKQTNKQLLGLIIAIMMFQWRYDRWYLFCYQQKKKTHNYLLVRYCHY